MSTGALEAGYWRACRDFYRWGSIFLSTRVHNSTKESLRHLAYAAGWKKFEPFWNWIIRAKRVTHFLPLLESVLAGFGSQDSRTAVMPDEDRSPANFSAPQRSVETP